MSKPGSFGFRHSGFGFSLGDVAQLGERWLCKPEVAGSIPVVSTETLHLAATVEFRCGFLARLRKKKKT
jgi:hypothetical protein